MSGEDVYDMARQWCHICAANHSDCEPQDFDSDLYCVICGVEITDEQHDLDGTGFCDAHRPVRSVGQP